MLFHYRALTTLFSLVAIATLVCYESEAQLLANNQKAYLDDRSPSSSNQRQKQQQQFDYQTKAVLRKKWHKLVDELIDQHGSNEAPPASAAEQANYRKPILGGYPIRKKWAAPNAEESEGGPDRIVILLKKAPPSSSSSEGDEQAAATNKFSLMNAISNNQWDSTNGDVQQQQRAMKMLAQVEPEGSGRQLPPAGHHRRVLDDKFGIVRDSIFTTNNHLGFKGVPKFGSEEEY